MVAIIDDSGRIWLESDPALSMKLGSRLSGPQLTEYAILNLGFISVADDGRFIRTACRPRILEPSAVATAIHCVNDNLSATIRLDYFTNDWNHFIVRDREAFQRIMVALAYDATSSPTKEQFLRKRLSRRDSPLRDTVTAARRIFTEWNSIEDWRGPLNRLFKRRWTINELDHETGHTIVRGIGDRYTPLNPSWLASAVGKSVCGYADEGYGHWVAAHHREAFASGRPMFDEIDAILEFPYFGNARTRYSRLVLAVPTTNGVPLVLSAAVTDSRIDLRGPRLHEAI
ncbi:MAG: hypothetical protein ACK5JT_08980 [Hyphomicrobiaceae bacterium]